MHGCIEILRLAYMDIYAIVRTVSLACMDVLGMTVSLACMDVSGGTLSLTCMDVSGGTLSLACMDVSGGTFEPHAWLYLAGP